MPCSLVGGAIALPDLIYKPAVGLILLIAALLLFRRATATVSTPASHTRRVRPVAELAVGSVIGLLSGLTATGGGVFLSPVLILFGWTTPDRRPASCRPLFC